MSNSEELSVPFETVERIETCLVEEFGATVTVLSNGACKYVLRRNGGTVGVMINSVGREYFSVIVIAMRTCFGLFQCSASNLLFKDVMSRVSEVLR